jgi:hypothetical protein
LHQSSGWQLLKLPVLGWVGIGRILKVAHCTPFYFVG